MSQQIKHRVTIKGTKEGLTFLLGDHCTFEDLLQELKEKLSSKHYQKDDGRPVRVNVVVGNRLLTSEQEQELKSIIQEGKNLQVEKFDCNVITKEEAERIRKNSQVHSLARVIRSGQVLEIEGDLLLIGDVNPGGSVIVSGNIYIMGALRGSAHAGCNGNQEAVIAASIMAPAQLRIANLFKQDLDQIEESVREMEYAYINKEENDISFAKIQHIQKMRPALSILK